MKKVVFLFSLFLLMGFTKSVTPLKGSEAPDFELVSPKGKTVKLSKLRGKMVLIDFWASWCKPCRNENPNVVQVYEKYRKRKFKDGKGLEIFSVSLDRDKSNWKKAIKMDGLKWKYHGWDEDNTVSNLYGVRSIPMAFLVNGDGVIVASGSELRGIQLHITLDNLLAD